MTNWASDDFRAAIARCRLHFIASFWFHGLVSLSVMVYPIYMIQVYERVVPSRNLASLIAIFTGAFIVIVFSGFFSYLEKKLLLNASLRVDRLLGAETFRALIMRSSAEQTETGAQILRDLAVARAYYTRTKPAAVVGAPWGALFLGVLFTINFFVGLAALGFLILEVLITLWNMRVTHDARVTAAEKGIKSQYMVEANIRSADAIVAMGVLPGLMRKWRAIDDEAVAAEARGGSIAAMFGGLNLALSTIMQLSILAVAIVSVLAGQMGAGFAFACIMAFGYMMRPLRDVIHAWEGYDEAKAAADRVNFLLQRYRRPDDSMSLPRPTGQIGCQRVVYYPPAANKPVLSGVTFGILAGTTVAIVGAIGSGKTTLVRLLVGLVRPTHGEVRLDGAQVAEWNRDDLGRHIGYLPQEIGLINGTVSENIGRLGLFNEQQIVEAAALAGVHNLILKLPQGYDTVIGEGGVRLSGGQKQLIGLARAVVGVPPLVVLDEPNSNLDGPGEIALGKCINSLKAAGSTVIMVSHRPTLVQDLDRVILLRDGTVAYDGPVDQFFEMSGRNIRVVKGIAGG